MSTSQSYSFVGESSNQPQNNQSRSILADEVLCLVCGAHANLEQDRAPSLVKVEPVEAVGREDEVFPQDVSTLGSGSSCWWSDEEQQLFHQFSRWFGLKLKGVQWNFEEESFPFCTVCKNQLISLLDVKRKIEELEEALRYVLEGLKNKVNVTEEKFQLSGVYQRDSRYSSVRGQISGNHIWINSAFKDISALLPFVRISTIDKATAEKNLNARQLQMPSTFKTSRGKGSNKKPPKNIRKVTQRKAKSVICKPEVVESQTVVSKLAESVTGKRKRPSPKKKLERNSPSPEYISFGSDDESSDSFKINERNKSNGDEDEDYVPLEDDFEAHQQSDFEDSGNSNDDDFDIEIPKKIPKPLPKHDGENASQLQVPDPNGDKVEPETLNVTENPVKPKRRVRRRKKRDTTEDEDTDDEPSDFEVHKHFANINDITEDSKVYKTPRRTSNGTKRVKIDPHTGILTCLKVQFKPLENDLYTCLKCSATVKRNGPYQQNMFHKHVLRVHSKRLVCPKCGYRAKSVSQLDSHINRIHKGIKIQHVKRYFCEFCGKNQPNKQRLHAHRWRVHYTEEDKVAALARGEMEPPPNPKEEKVQCEDCGALINRSGMPSHKLCRHGTEEEQAKAKILCTICGKQEYYFNMLQHVNQRHPEVNGIPSHTCGECGKVFKLKPCYMRHLKVHRGLEYKCKLCGKGFRTSESYTGHMNLHNNVRPYPCGHCSLAFASEAIRKKHFRHYHAEGSTPKRPPFLRGLERKNRVDVGSISQVDSEVNKVESNLS